MNLQSLINKIENDIICVKHFRDIEVMDVTIDSREKLKASVFIAVKGFKTDGIVYADTAISNGAEVIVHETEIEDKKSEIIYIKVKKSREIIPKIAFFIYSESHLDKIKLIGVTGTNGKTSFVHILKHIITSSDKICGYISTIDYDLGNGKVLSERTTPEATKIHRYLKKMRQNKCEYALMEVSSHALSLNRIDNLQFDISVFSNLTEDHFDFHKNYENYSEAKAKLFNSFTKKTGFSILNNDDSYFSYFKENSVSKVLSYGLNSTDNDLQVTNFKYENNRLNIDFTFEKDTNFSISTSLLGDFQVYNISSAVLSALKLGFTIKEIKDAFNLDIQICGRLERVGLRNIFVDYAHTSDAIKNACKTLINVGSGNLYTVFGCGGDRDKSKRSEMGREALSYSKKIIITNDNPRFENPQSIIEDITKDMTSNDNYIVIADRTEAIEYAIKNTNENDVILIAGKGHENYQEIKGVKYPFSDQEVVKAILNR